MADVSPAEAIYFAALDLPPAERARYLDGVCSGQQELRQRVERMLADAPRVGQFLEPPRAPEPSTGAIPTAEGPGTIIAGKYKLLQRIGEGGMAASGWPTRPNRSSAAWR